MAVAETIESPHQRFRVMAELTTVGYPKTEKHRAIESLGRLRVQAGKLPRQLEREQALEAIAIVCIEFGEIDVAVEIYEQLGITVERIRSLLDGAYRLRYGKQFKESDRLLVHITAAIKDVVIDDPSKRDEFLAYVSKHYAKNDDIATALPFARSIADAARRESALVEVAIESMPYQAPEQALEIIANVADSSKKTRVVDALIKHLCENGWPDEAVKYLKLLDDYPSGQDDARASIAVVYAENGRIAESEKLFAEIEEDYALALAAKTLAPKLVKLGNISKAREHANSIKNGYNRCKVLAEMGGACLSLGNDNEAMTLFNEAKDIVQTFDDPFRNIPLLEAIARAAAENGKIDYALEIAESMKGKGIQLIDKWEVLSILAWKFQDSGNTQKALKVAGMIDERGTRYSSFSNIASMLAYEGKNAEAIEIISNYIPKGSDREYALLYIVWEFANRKSFHQALEVSETMSDPELKAEALSFIGISYDKTMEIPTSGETIILWRIIRNVNHAK